MKKLFRIILSLFVASNIFFSPLNFGDLNDRQSSFVVYAEGEATAEEIKVDAMTVFLTMLLSNGVRFVGNLPDQIDGLDKAFNDWLTETGYNITAAGIAAGSVIYNGYLKVSEPVTAAYNSFASWLTNTFDLTNDDSFSITVSEGGYTGYENSVSNTVFKYSAYGYSYSLTGYNRDCRLFAQWDGQDVVIYCVSNTPSAYAFFQNKVWYRTTANYNGVTFYCLSSNSNEYGGVRGATNVYNITNGFVLDSVSSLNSNRLQQAYLYYQQAYGGIGDVSLEGETLTLKDGLNLETDQAQLFDLAYLAEYAGIMAQNITDLNELANTLSEALDRANDETDSESLPWDLIDSTDDTKVIPDGWTIATPTEASLYKTLGLEKVFPFSIPFDMYYFIKMFQAEAQALNFDIPFVVEGVINQNYHVDLSIFDSVALVFRSMMLIGWIWFLISKTKDYIKW